MSLTRTEMLAVIARGEVVTYRDSVLRTAADVPSDAQIAADVVIDTAAAALVYNGDAGFRFAPAGSNRPALTSDITKANAGLSNADNTSDADKPVSTAQQTALDLKANKTAPIFLSVPATDPHIVGALFGDITGLFISAG